MKIGFIGLGNVGGKLAGSLLRNKFDLTVRDLDENLTNEFKNLGAKVASSAKELAEQVDLIITCLPSPIICADVMEGENGVLEGITQNKIWKFVIMVMSSLPLAIIANSIRVTTIVLIAEFWDAEFAARTYHNFSGFLFFPLGIIGIILIGFLLNSGWKSKQKVISRQLVSGKESKGKDTEKIKGDDT